MFKQTIYHLKQRYGVKATLYRVEVTSITDDFGASQDVTETAVPVKVVLLPVSYKVEEELGQRFKGDVKVGDRQLVIEEAVTTGDYVAFNDKRWQVIDVADYEGYAQLALIRNVQDES